MITFFSNVAETIILTIVVCTILEMILPNSKNKKYIKVIMGIYLIFNIISPFISNKEIMATDINTLVNQNINTSSQIAPNQNSMDERLEKIYEQKLDEEIEKKIKEFGYNVNSLTVDAKLLGDNAGIYGIKVNVSKCIEDSNENNQNNVKSVNEVENIKVSIGDIIKDKIEEKKNNTEEEKNLQKNISDFYQIDKSKVNITIE